MTGARTLPPVLPHHAPDRFGLHLLLTLAVLTVLVVVYLLMIKGWRNRRRRAASLPPPAAVPADLGRLLLPEAEVLLVGTTRADDWLDRVTAHGLGARAAAGIAVHEAGVVVSPSHRDPFLLPAADLRGARTDSAHAGRVLPGGRLGVLRFVLGPGTYELGFRPDQPAGLPALIAAVDYLVPDGSDRGEALAAAPPATPSDTSATGATARHRRPSRTPRTRPDRKVPRP